MRRICVFCGSSKGAKQSYETAAKELAHELVRQGTTLVYGGGNVGLMGILADAVMAAGGEVIGVMPEALVAKEVAHKGITELKVVKSMHERKAIMADLSDGFVALPGGFGTFEEFFEVVTWTQLGLHKKPCGLLNTDGFYDPLLLLVRHATEEKFIRPEHAMTIVSHSEPKALIQLLENWSPIEVEKWIDRNKS